MHGGYTPEAAYRYAITGDYSDTGNQITLRLRCEDGTRIAVYQDGKLSLVNAQRDGSYAVFPAAAEGQILVLRPIANPAPLIALCAAVAVLIAASVFVVRRGRRRRRG